MTGFRKYSVVTLLLGILMFTGVFAQTQSQNYLKSEAVLVPRSDEGQLSGLSNNEIRKTVAYFDALGKSVQTIDIEVSPAEKDIVSPVEYDVLGLQSKARLPYVLSSGSNDGNFQNNALNDQENFYNFPPNGVASTDNPFAETIYQKSPLLPALERGSVGNVWQPGSGHTIRTSYNSNDVNEDVRIWVFDETNETAASSEAYITDELYVTELTDEHDNKSYEYTDKTGRLILRRVIKSASEELLTYQVYDEFDNLRMIIPPEAVELLKINSWNLSAVTPQATKTIKERWVTTFKYDGFQRIVEKQLPEMLGPVNTLYDRLGRVVLTQDPNMEANDQWAFTKFDIHGRAIMTGIYTETDPSLQTRQDMQTYVDDYVDGTSASGHFAYYETRDNTKPEGYTENTFPPVSDCQPWSITYYDDYDFPNASNFSYIQDTEYDPNNDKKFDRLKGLVTCSKIRVLGNTNVYNENNRSYGAGHTPSQYPEVYYKGNNIRLIPGFRTQQGQTVKIGPNITPGAEQVQWLTAVSYYDKYSRVIQTQSDNHVGGVDISFTEYDFPGKVLNTKLIHQTPYATVTVRNEYQYDHAGRLTRVYHQIGDNAADKILMKENVYNELGQLIEKNLHSTDAGTTFAQSVDYRYHERGWLVEVNKSDLSSDGTNEYGSSDLFGMALEYEDSPAGITTNSAGFQYNGNISGMAWKVSIDPSVQS